MISNRNWLVLFALSLLCSSILLFILHFEIFHDFHHILIYTIHDLAFLPVEVLLVTVILHQMLERQAMKNKLNKLNMVIGVFFSEIGVPLMRVFASYDLELKMKTDFFSSLSTWDHVTFLRKKKEAMKFHFYSPLSCENLVSLREMLLQKEDLMIRMLENPMLLEHESFTDLLQAIFHLTDELRYRGDCMNLPDSDIHHLSGDITRGYSLMIPTWLTYLEYLKTNYPYLYSLAVRTNPFSENVDVIIRE
ncbi:hypothetical protein ACKUB1_16130 [Methanospirillum stamsii]|uniref:Uncharacterized protein n=1 Tax=Methanospirillum stamsii TaxID=1277351 RepID=A0A2V2MWH0_9EURY|nr:hypothetical protein [Methanospirillum stamsii]PWR69756.1 hypothetical protein DLD82_17000 [Methanospirillum stamsii]